MYSKMQKAQRGCRKRSRVQKAQRGCRKYSKMQKAQAECRRHRNGRLWSAAHGLKTVGFRL